MQGEAAPLREAPVFSSYGSTTTEDYKRGDDAVGGLTKGEEELKDSKVLVVSSGGDEPGTTLTLTCFFILTFAAFLGDTSRGLVTPSIAPYIVEAGGSSSFVGWTNGAYSVGRMVAAPFFGWWAERRTYREAILANLVIFVLGNALYALAEHSKYLILFSRLLVGLGAGTLGLSRGYVAETTSHRDRSGYMAWLTAAQFIGYSVTPGIGALLSFADFTIVGSLKFNTYTAAGYLLVLCGLLNAIMLIVAWIEPAKPPEKEVAEESVSVSDSGSYLGHVWEGILCFLSPSSAHLALFVVLQFLTRFVVAAYETAGQLFATELFQWSVFEFGLIACVFGLIGTCVLFLQKPLARKIPDESVLIVGLAALSLGLFLFPPLGVLSGHRTAEIAQYDIASVLIFGLGYPISQALLVSFFSKALGPMPQSTIMGMMASLGSASKVVGAVVAGWTYQTVWLAISFYAAAVLLSLSTVGTVVYFKNRKGKK